MAKKFKVKRQKTPKLTPEMQAELLGRIAADTPKMRQLDNAIDGLLDSTRKGK